MQERLHPFSGQRCGRMVHYWHLLLLTVLLGFSGPGCVIFPTPLSYLQIGEELHLEQFQINRSTKEEVLEQTTPDLILADQNKFLYFWLESDSGVSIITYQGDGTTRKWDKHLGLIQFDEMDVVKNLWSGRQPAHRYSLEALVYGKPVADRMNARSEEHRRSFLLMRVAIDIDGHRLEKPLDNFIIKGLGIRTFREFKVIRHKRIKRKFTDDGWVVLEAMPGEVRYISFSKTHRITRKSGYGDDDLNGPAMDAFKKVDLPDNLFSWKISVPEDSYIYAGTFLFSNREKGSRTVHCDEARDESDLALDVIRQQFSEDADMAVSLAEKHSKPYVMRIPPAYK